MRVPENMLRHICRHHSELRIYVSEKVPATYRHTSAGSHGAYRVARALKGVYPNEKTTTSVTLA